MSPRARSGWLMGAIVLGFQVFGVVSWWAARRDIARLDRQERWLGLSESPLSRAAPPSGEVRISGLAVGRAAPPPGSPVGVAAVYHRVELYAETPTAHGTSRTVLRRWESARRFLVQVQSGETVEVDLDAGPCHLASLVRAPIVPRDGKLDVGGNAVATPWLGASRYYLRTEWVAPREGVTVIGRIRPSGGGWQVVEQGLVFTGTEREMRERLVALRAREAQVLRFLWLWFPASLVIGGSVLVAVLRREAR